MQQKLRSIIDFVFIMESLSLEEENIIKDIRNLFRLTKKQNYTVVKDTWNLFRLKKQIKELKIWYLEILRIYLRMKKKKKIIIIQ